MTVSRFDRDQIARRLTALSKSPRGPLPPSITAAYICCGGARSGLPAYQAPHDDVPAAP